MCLEKRIKRAKDRIHGNTSRNECPNCGYPHNKESFRGLSQEELRQKFRDAAEERGIKLES